MRRFVSWVGVLATVWVMAARRGLLDHEVTSDEWRDMILNGLGPVAIFLLSVPIAYLVSPDAARTFWLLLLVVNPAIGRFTTRAEAKEGEGT